MTVAQPHSPPAPAADNPVLRVRNLRVGYRTPRGPLWAVDGVDLDVAPGESVGLVGESGCGKSSLGRALINLMPPGGGVRGEVHLAARGDTPSDGALDLVSASPAKLRSVRGERVSLVFQEPMTRLDPLMRVSDHFIEAVRSHRPQTSKREAKHMAEDALAQMGIPRTRVDNFPHEFSGGMRQRIMIALGIVMHPQLVIADEPTTSLDVIVEAQILDILGRLRRHENVGLLLVTHNLGIVAETCDRVAVMYAGKVVEIGPVDAVFAHPKHPYTQGLLASTISLETTELHSIAGAPPDLVHPPPGCRFAPRCPEVMDRCPEVVPLLAAVDAPAQGGTSEGVRAPPVPAGRQPQYAACLLHPGTDPAEVTRR